MNMSSPPAKTTHLMVENVHCAGCMSKIERTLNALDGVSNARLNMSTRRLQVNWIPGLIDDSLIADKLTSLGYPARAYDPEKLQSATDREGRMLLVAMAVAGFAAANVMLLSVSVWAGAFADMGPATRSLFHWISALIALPAIAYACRPFVRSAVGALKGGTTNMDVPISLAILLSAALSLWQTVENGQHAYFDASVTLLFFLLVGRYLDHRMRAKANSAAEHLISLSVHSAHVRQDDGRIVSLSADEVKPGDALVVTAGERLAADGLVCTGESEIDTSLLTGESIPERISVGSRVYAGTINHSGVLEVTVTSVGPDTFLAELVRLMEKAEQGQAKFIRIADRIARAYAPVVHLLAAGSFLLWWGLFDVSWQAALATAISVLIITCPCALALAVPVVQVVASGALFRNGILVKSGDALEKLAQVDTILFDKTGTLTLGKPVPRNLAQLDAPTRVLAASLAAHSHHPLSRALSAAVADDPLSIDEIGEFPGNGLKGIFQGRNIRLGRRQWCGADQEEHQTSGAYQELWFAQEGEAPVCITFEDRLRADAIDTVTALKQAGYRVMMISGDRQAVTAQTAAALGITDWRAEVRPDEKLQQIKALHEAGQKTLMVGDGLNDAPALAAGFVSMAPAAAADVSRTAADLVFQGEGLAPVATALGMARTADRLVKQNFALALLYNLVAIPIAVAGLATPLVAALAMSSSSLIVTLNAFRLRLNR